MTTPAAGREVVRTARWSAVLVDLPARLPVVVFWAALVVAISIQLGAFTPMVVLPALIVVLLLVRHLAPEPAPRQGHAVLGAGLALGMAALWLALNLPFASEILLVQRDPGFLALQSIWLAGNSSPHVPLGSALEMAELVDGARLGSDAFWRDGASLYAQGAKTVPGLWALAGWVGAAPALLAANLGLGAIALVAVYDVARRLTDPLWGLLPMLALALTTPMLYFTRTPFTEPLNIILTFGGLAVLWTLRAEPPQWRFLLGGAMLGANALGRIDGAAVAAGMVLGIAAVAAGARSPRRRRSWSLGVLSAGGAASAMVVLGYVDLARNSPKYLEDHAHLYAQLVGLMVASLAAAALLLWLTSMPRLRHWLESNSLKVARIGAAGVIAAAALLASRPLWLQARWFEGRPEYMAFIAAFQADAGVAVDGARSYDEMTLVWLSWYLGPVTVVLAALASAMMLGEVLVKRRATLAVPLATLGLPTLMYVVQPSITPDQVWAMRRFLPVAIPAILLAAAWLLHRTHRLHPGRWPRVGVGAAVVLMLLSPLATWGRLVTTVEHDGRAAQVAALCGVVQGRPVVAVRPSGPPLLPTLRVMCGSDVIEVSQRPTAQELAALHAWAGHDLFVAIIADDPAPIEADEVAGLATQTTRWPHTLYPSSSPVSYVSTIWVGRVLPDGSVTPAAP